MIMNKILYEKILKYLLMLKQGKQITTRTQMQELNELMEKVNSKMYE